MEVRATKHDDAIGISLTATSVAQEDALEGLDANKNIFSGNIIQKNQVKRR